MGIAFSDSSSESSPGQHAYHILRIQQNSPAQLAGLQPVFDFILTINGHSVNGDQQLLDRELRSHQGQTVYLHVASTKQWRRQGQQSMRHVTLTPRDDWGGRGLIGASVRLCSSVAASGQCRQQQPLTAWRVLDVAAGSPADMAGLRPGTDYIVGAAEAPLKQPGDLFDLVELRHRRELRLYVYCRRVDACREVAVTPDPGWGGEGALGCGIGYGYLHQIPADDKADDVYDRGEPLPETANSMQHLPTDLPSAPLGSIKSTADDAADATTPAVEPAITVV